MPTVKFIPVVWLALCSISTILAQDSAGNWRIRGFYGGGISKRHFETNNYNGSALNEAYLAYAKSDETLCYSYHVGCVLGYRCSSKLNLNIGLLQRRYSALKQFDVASNLVDPRRQKTFSGGIDKIVVMDVDFVLGSQISAEFNFFQRNSLGLWLETGVVIEQYRKSKRETSYYYLEEGIIIDIDKFIESEYVKLNIAPFVGINTKIKLDTSFDLLCGMSIGIQACSDFNQSYPLVQRWFQCAAILGIQYTFKNSN